MIKMNWINKCEYLKYKWGYKKEDFNDLTGINLYCFILTLSELLQENSCVVSTAGSSYYICAQGLRLKKDSHHISTTSAEMGNGLALSIGSSFARNKKDVVLIDGDSSFMCCVDELGTVVAN